jgi:hypothetical protein
MAKFYFSRPHNLFRGEEFAGCRRASLRYATPCFPVEVDGVGKLHAAFFTESRTRGRVQRSVAGNPGSLRSHGEPGQAGWRVTLRGWEILGHVSIAVTRCWGFERLLRIEFPLFKGRRHGTIV